MKLAAPSLGVLIQIALEEHEISLGVIQRRFPDDRDAITDAVKNLVKRELLQVYAVDDDWGLRSIYALTTSGRDYVNYLGDRLRDEYVH